MSGWDDLSNRENDWDKLFPIITPKLTFVEQIRETIKEGDKIINSPKGDMPFKTTLQIPVDDGWPITLEAIVVGDLAVHKQHEDSRVTHVPTLTKFQKAVPDSWDIITDEQLLNWCRKVQEDELNLWAIIRRYDNSNYHEIPEDVLDKLKGYCRGIAI